MAKVYSSSWLLYLVLLLHQNTWGDEIQNIKRTKDLLLITTYRDVIDKQIKDKACDQDYNLLGADSIFQDYSFWDKEIRAANNVANYLTSMWRFKNKNNRSFIENEPAIYSLSKTIALSSEQIFGSVVCFDAYKFKGRRKFCPYAFKNHTAGRNRTMIHDLARSDNDYLANPSSSMRGNATRHSFIWWHVGRADFVNATAQLRQNTVCYDTDLDTSDSNSVDVSGNVTTKYYNITSTYVPIKHGKWTTPYYDCFGGQTWMFTYLVPFYDEADTFLGLVSFDIELDSIDVDECDVPLSSTPEKTDGNHVVQFYGAHKCHNTSTKCVHVRGGGFNPGSYRCVCRKGFYFPKPNAKRKYFDGKDVMNAKPENKSLFQCLPCREGCLECVDGTPCMYQRNISLRTVFLTINEAVKALAIGLAVFISVYRESKIIKASSPVFMEIISFGVILMYCEVTLGYFEDSVRLCIAKSWLYHTGFILAFGSLLLKTWRIAVIFRLRTAKMIELTDRTLLKYLLIMVAAFVCYLMIWTWTQTHEFEIKKTSGDYKYKRCVRGWFSNAIEIGEVLLLIWGVWLCLRVRNAPSAYNESKYIAWCIYNSVFITILVGLLRIVLDNFHNPDVSYVVDFLSTHVVATIMLVLLFVSKIYLLRKFNKDSARRSHRANSATSTTATDLRKSPFHLNRLVDGTLVCETEDERTTAAMEIENHQLREEIRSLTAKLAVFENKLARENKRKGSSPEEDYTKNGDDFQVASPDSETESSRDVNGFTSKRQRKRSAAAESTTSNGSVFMREEKVGSLIDDIKNAGKHENFLAVPKQNSVSDEETLTVMSNISSEST